RRRHLRRPWSRPADLDRRGPARALLRLDTADARARRALHGRAPAQARGARGDARRALRRARGLDGALPSRPLLRGAPAPGRARLRPVRELRQSPEPARKLDALLDGALEPLLPHRQVEAGFAEGVRERAEGVPVERLRGHRALACVDVLRGRHAPELLAELTQQANELLARREPARDEAGAPLRRVPAPEVLDDRLRVDGRLRIGR